MKIGIFDSGIGGVSVLHEALHLLPEEEYIFYADTDHVPYGKKTPEEIRQYAEEITEFLIRQKVEAIVIACNTATSVAAAELRKKFCLPIIGMEPAVKPAVQIARNLSEQEQKEERVLVMATPVTIRENKLKDLLHRVDQEHACDLLPMPELVTFAESGDFENPEVDWYLQRQLETLPFPLTRYSVLVLGCTHFNYFKPQYRHFLPSSTRIIDGNEGTVRHLADVCGLSIQEEKAGNPDNMDQNVSYYFSGHPVTEEGEISFFRHLHKRLEQVRNIR